MVVWCASLLSNHPESLFFFVLLFWDQLLAESLSHCMHTHNTLTEGNWGRKSNLVYVSKTQVYMQFVSNQISAQAQGLWV